MSNKISRRTFLKCTGASAAALGAAAMLGGCGSSTSNAIEVKVGDKVSNWNNLGVQLTSVFTMANTPDLPDHEYVAVLNGWITLEKTVKYIKSKYPEIFLIADAKRGDIGNTSE